ncbi:hypothetical protein ARMSODRAFT_965277 [Armillaria solidipes]|uniref:Uncharacterized protein n=1 Tax=Armillaria solidipes TaxID=1076256 RepID=A0A2H3AQR0_9AGAR|nr:hypothetical protein ARMSODRAFT_965277 [Armillaria solidipes]
MGYFLKLEIFARYSMKELNCTCSYRDSGIQCSMKCISIPIEWLDTIPFEQSLVALSRGKGSTGLPGWQRTVRLSLPFPGGELWITDIAVSMKDTNSTMDTISFGSGVTVSATVSCEPSRVSTIKTVLTQ